MAATVGASLSGVTFPRRHSGVGPFISSGGTVYFFGRDSANTGQVEPHKASAPMTSFTAQTLKTMSSGTSTAIEAMSCVQNGNVVYVFTQISTGAVYFNFYTMDTDAWGLTTSATTIAAASVAPVSGATFVSAAHRPTAGELVLAYCAGQTAMSSTFNMIRYVRVNASTGAVIGSAVNVDNGGSINWMGAVAAPGASDKVHFFLSDATNFNGYQRTLTAANTLQTFPASWGRVGRNFSYQPGASYVDSGPTRVRIPVEQFSGTSGQVRPTVLQLDSADAPTVSIDPASAYTVTMRSNALGLGQTVHTLSADGDTLHYLYALSADNDLYHDSSTGGGGAWGAEVNEFAGTVQELTSSVYTRSGAKYLAMVLDDNGTLKYAEIALTSGPATVTGASSLAGSGAISAAGTRARSGSVALSGSGALSGAGVRARTGAASLAGSGAVSASGTRIRSGAASLVGSGSLSASGTRIRSGASSLSGAGALAAAGEVASGFTVHEGASSLTGSGALSASGTRTTAGASTLSGSGALSGEGAHTAIGVAALSGDGALEAAGLREAQGAASLHGSGELEASSSGIPSGRALLSGSGDLSATGTRIRSGAADLSGSADLAASGYAVVSGASALSGAGDLAAGGTRITLGASSLTGTGDLSGTGTATRMASAALSGSGDLQAAGGGAVTGAANLAGSGDLSSPGVRVRLAASALSGSGTLAASAVRARKGRADLSGGGQLSGEGAYAAVASVALAGSGDLVAEPSLLIYGDADLLGSGFFYGLGRRDEETPAWRIYLVSQEVRASAAAVEARFLSVAFEDRAHTIAREVRDYDVPQEMRETHATEDGRLVAAGT